MNEKERTPRTRVKLSEAEYFKFRALMGDVSSNEAAARQSAIEFAKRAEVAIAKAREYFAALAKAYGFDDKQDWQWNDDTQEIFVVEAKANGMAAPPQRTEALQTFVRQFTDDLERAKAEWPRLRDLLKDIATAIAAELVEGDDNVIH